MVDFRRLCSLAGAAIGGDALAALAVSARAYTAQHALSIRPARTLPELHRGASRCSECLLARQRPGQNSSPYASPAHAHPSREIVDAQSVVRTISNLACANKAFAKRGADRNEAMNPLRSSASSAARNARHG